MKTSATPIKSPSENRRQLIFAGLRACILDKGYANTTLADIARAAGMSPSHLLYYFSDKSDILAQYFAAVSERIAARLEDFRGKEPHHKIDLLAQLFFSGKALSKAEIGFMLECFGVAVHAPSLKQRKAELDHLCKGYLLDLFGELGCERQAVPVLAEVAYAILVGLRTAVYFDEDLSVEQAHAIFRNEMLRMVATRKRPALNESSRGAGAKRRSR